MKISENIRKTYTSFAVFALTAVLLLSLSIAALLLYESTKTVEMSEANPRVYNKIIARGIRSLQKVYPARNTEEIREILFETWTRPYFYEPFTQFRERPYSGNYVRVDPNGFRKVAKQKPWPPKKENFNIFMFGGSTLFGYGVPDEDTIASFLGQYLEDAPGNKPVAVYNFGRGYYYSTQERILYEQLLTEGHVPDLAIFVDGLNEFYFSSNQPLMTEGLEKIINKPAKKEMFTQQINDLKQKTIDAYKWLVNRTDLKKVVHGNSSMKESVVDNYLQNMQIISAVSKAYNVTPLFVWQPVPTYKYDVKFHVFSSGGFGEHIASRSGYEYMQNLVLENPPKGHFLWLADIQEDLQEPLYVDKVHYTAEFSRTIAKELAAYISEQELVLSH